MNPNPRSDTIFFTVPFGIARSPPLEHRIERIGPVRERRMPAAREITRRPGERAYFTTLPRRGAEYPYELVQRADVRSRAAGDHGCGEQHYVRRLECPRRRANLRLCTSIWRGRRGSTGSSAP